MTAPPGRTPATNPVLPPLSILFGPQSMGEAALVFVATLTVLALIVAAFLISTTLGLAAGFLATAILTIWVPTQLPFVIVIAFMFQNTVIAFFSPMVAGDEAFDTVRGVNFVMLMTAFAGTLAASLINSARDPRAAKTWLRAALLPLLVILIYLGLGLVRGMPRDALVYFRNTVTPIATFYIGLVIAGRYRVDMGKALRLIGWVAVIYGYCELIFTFDFLSLFHGDRYLQLSFARQIESGYWEKTLEQTGFVLHSLKDAMMTRLFNLSLFGPLPEVFRISGPPFHPISYAYGLSVIVTFTIFGGGWLLPFAAFPLLVIVGSKGAAALFLFGVFAYIGRLFFQPKTLFVLIGVLNLVWIVGALVLGLRAADYHVLGLMAGLHGFLADPVGQGLGIGGNLSSAAANLNWNRAQAVGATGVPVESAVGVMLYQMGVFSLVVMGFVLALAMKMRTLFLATGQPQFLFGFVIALVMMVNAVLQEEAFYAPLAMGFALLLIGIALGNHIRVTERTGGA